MTMWPVSRPRRRLPARGAVRVRGSLGATLPASRAQDRLHERPPLSSPWRRAASLCRGMFPRDLRRTRRPRAGRRRRQDIAMNATLPTASKAPSNMPPRTASARPRRHVVAARLLGRRAALPYRNGSDRRGAHSARRDRGMACRGDRGVNMMGRARASCECCKADLPPFPAGSRIEPCRSCRRPMVLLRRLPVGSIPAGCAASSTLPALSPASS